eukprot:COSAG05_NODE_2454_length_3040_cov_5.465353_2_plen_171_part_00
MAAAGKPSTLLLVSGILLSLAILLVCVLLLRAVCMPKPVDMQGQLDAAYCRLAWAAAIQRRLGYHLAESSGNDCDLPYTREIISENMPGVSLSLSLSLSLSHAHYVRASCVAQEGVGGISTLARLSGRDRDAASARPRSLLHLEHGARRWGGQGWGAVSAWARRKDPGAM